SVVLVMVAAGVAAVPIFVSPFMASRQIVSANDAFQDGNWELAQKSYAAAATLQPASWEAERGLALVLRRRYERTHEKEDLDQAIHHQRRAIERNRLSGFLWWELGSYLRDAEDKTEALACFEKAVQF